jgi:hypothetical protein
MFAVAAAVRPNVMQAIEIATQETSVRPMPSTSDAMIESARYRRRASITTAIAAIMGTQGKVMIKPAITRSQARPYQ